MKLIEKKCAECGNPIYVYEDFAREEMFCTLHCMERSAFSDMTQYTEPVNFKTF